MQESFREILTPIIGTAEGRIASAVAIHGGELPSWFDPTTNHAAADGKGALEANPYM